MKKFLFLLIIILLSQTTAMPQEVHNPTPRELGLPFVEGISYKFSSANMNTSVYVVEDKGWFSLQGGTAIFGVSPPFKKWREGPTGEIFAQWSQATIGQWIPKGAKDIKLSSAEIMLFPSSLAVGEEWDFGSFTYRVPPFDPVTVELRGRPLTTRIIMDRDGQFDIPDRNFSCLPYDAPVRMLEIYERWGTLSMKDRVFFQFLWSPGIGIIAYSVGDHQTKTSREVAWLTGFQKIGHDINHPGGKAAVTWGNIKNPS